MSISALFSGMEAYLDGDVEITNNVDVPANETEAAEETAETAGEVADGEVESKENEVANQMLSKMTTMYYHVKQFGIDRTFVSLYNRHGELNRVCGMQFPSCESMDVSGSSYSNYSQAFIAAMEDEGEGLWARFKALIAKIWNWIKNTASGIWNKLKSLFGFNKNALQKALAKLKSFNPKTKIVVSGAAASVLDGSMFGGDGPLMKWVNDMRTVQSKVGEVFGPMTSFAGQIASAAKLGPSTGTDKFADKNYGELRDAAEKIFGNVERFNSDYFGNNGLLKMGVLAGIKHLLGSKRASDAADKKEAKGKSVRLEAGDVVRRATKLMQLTDGMSSGFDANAKQLEGVAAKIKAAADSIGGGSKAGAKLGSMVSKMLQQVQKFISSLQKQAQSVNSLLDSAAKAVNQAASTGAGNESFDIGSDNFSYDFL
jgi:hypothetical protein